MSTTTEQTVNERLVEIGRNLRTQDNRCTNAPIFIVEERRRIYGMDPDYSDHHVWIDGCNDYEEASPAEARKLDRKYERGDDINECWTRTAYIDIWEFVTACFTEQGCKDYLAANGHNHRETRIYAAGSWRNAEWNAVRDYLLALSPTPEGEPR